MRILVISGFYPPNTIGGYEIMCKEAVDELIKRGHNVHVLTSSYGSLRPEGEDHVFRALKTTCHREMKKTRRGLALLQREITNRRIFQRWVQNYRPDIIYIWHLSEVSISIAHDAHASGIPVAYYVLDHWMSDWLCDPFRGFWEGPSKDRLRAWAKKIAKFIIKAAGLLPTQTLDLKHAQFASQYLYRLVAPHEEADTNGQIIPWGIDTKKFSFREHDSPASKILYVGQIIEHKGLQTAIEAVASVTNANQKNVRLSIAGDYDAHPYGHDLYKRVISSSLKNCIEFKGFIPYERIMDMYSKHDILVFPSLWDEPFGNTLLEAMASGLAVVATGTGGSGEILRDNDNCLLFAPGDADACAGQIVRLISDPDLYERIRRAGRKTVEEEFRFETTMDAIEKNLFQAAGESG